MKPSLPSKGPIVQRGGVFVRKYEVIFIVRPMDEEATNAVIEKFSKLLVDNGATIDKEDRWGKKRLAYEIKDCTDGYYCLFNFTAEPACAAELDRVMKITDEVLKHMIVREDEEASFTLAVNRRFVRNADQQQADFIPIVVWDKLAEICGNNLVKGSQVLVEGRMQIRSYDAQDGTKRYVTEVVAQDIEFMGSRPTGAAPVHAAAPMNNSNPSPMGGAAASFGSELPPDEEIPF